MLPFSRSPSFFGCVCLEHPYLCHASPLNGLSVVRRCYWTELCSSHSPILHQAGSDISTALRASCLEIDYPLVAASEQSVKQSLQWVSSAGGQGQGDVFFWGAANITHAKTGLHLRGAPVLSDLWSRMTSEKHSKNIHMWYYCHGRTRLRWATLEVRI